MELLNIFNIMPGWAQFLVAWPLPSLIVALILRSIFKEELHSRHKYDKERAQTMIWVASIIYPIFLMVASLALFGTIWDLVMEDIPKLWHRFGTWVTNKRKQRQRLKKYKAKSKPKSSDPISYVHYFKDKRFRCGVGTKANKVASKNIATITCPICLGLMENDRGDGA